MSFLDEAIPPNMLPRLGLRPRSVAFLTHCSPPVGLPRWLSAQKGDGGLNPRVTVNLRYTVDNMGENEADPNGVCPQAVCHHFHVNEYLSA